MKIEECKEGMQVVDVVGVEWEILKIGRETVILEKLDNGYYLGDVKPVDFKKRKLQ